MPVNEVNCLANFQDYCWIRQSVGIFLACVHRCKSQIVILRDVNISQQDVSTYSISPLCVRPFFSFLFFHLFTYFCFFHSRYRCEPDRSHVQRSLQREAEAWRWAIPSLLLLFLTHGLFRWFTESFFRQMTSITWLTELPKLELKRYATAVPFTYVGNNLFLKR